MKNVVLKQSLLRTIGIIGLLMVLISQSPDLNIPFIPHRSIPYIVIISVFLIAAGLYFKLKYAEEEPSTITYIFTIITLITALLIAVFLLNGILYNLY